MTQHSSRLPKALGATIIVMFLAVLGVVPCSSSSAAEQQSQITLQLSGPHQFQFAGYYAALEKGFYRQEGLEVSLIERSPKMDATTEVIDGRADFGVNGPKILLDYFEGAPIRVLAAIFQHSPDIIISRDDAGINGPPYLRGKRFTIDRSTPPAILGMLKTQGVDPQTFMTEASPPTVGDIINGSADAIVGRQTEHPFALRQAGIPISSMRPISYGIDFYGDCLFTSERLAKKDPALVEAFTRASLKGWDYAMAHSNEIIGVIYSKYVTNRSWSALVFEAKAMRGLLLPKLVQTGSMTHNRWEHIADVYRDIGLTSNERPLDDFIYVSRSERKVEWLKRWSPYLLPTGLVAALMTLTLLFFNRRLKNGIERRTRELENSRQSLRQVIDLVPDMVYVTNREGLFLLANRAAADYHGFTVNELTGKKLTDVYNQAEAQRLIAEDLEVLDTGFPKVVLEEPFHHRDGSTRWLQTTKLPYTSLSTGEVAVLGLSVDITNRKLADEALKNSEERFRAIFNQTYQFTGIVDLDGILVQVNDSALKIFSLTRTEVVGKPFCQSGWWEQDDKTQDWINSIIKRASEGEIIREETIHVLPDGSRLNLDFSIKPAIDENGEILFLIPEGRDITALKKTEEELRQLNEELEHRVSERTRNLEEAKRELENSLNELHKMQEELILSEKLAALGGLVAGVAHEINTPLGIGVTASSFLQESMVKLNRKFDEGSLKRSDLEKFIATGTESTSSILTNLNRAAELIRSFKQVAADQSSEIPRTFNLREYIDEVLLSLRPKYKRTNHTIENTCPDVTIFSYPGAFMQIVTNLLVNSLTHAFEENEAGHITISGKVEDDSLMFTYSDDGMGIPPQIMDKVFEPFYTTKRGKGGTGLGLHIVFNTVTQTLGGTIRFTSAPGEGTTFTIQLPVDTNPENNDTDQL
ncbi:ABC transporter substrate-binding protein [uncultured Pseudodesulfovibrio sp.]|uniref:ABC transporter substrate-binding protein n=1 Tax=uncultured Pseudodesulfovibrio sp. TaxID=2035858 RepID=UPI0029C8D597|nr:ABC transporter substrate-binding protein [uncultured Pseudodesulfovibrio sp.]